MSGPLYYDRVLETSTTTSAGTYTLAGAVTGYRAFSVVGNTNTCFYAAYEVDGNGNSSGGWEIGHGTWATGGTLARTAITASSNSNNAVSWAAGTRRIALTIPAAIANVACMVYNNAAQSIPNTTFTAITFNSENFDPAGLHSTVTNTARITVTYPGVYLIQGTIAYEANATGTRFAAIQKNGTTYLSTNAVPNAGAVFQPAPLTMTIEFLAATDYVELHAYQDSGGALNTAQNGTYHPSLNLVRQF